MRTPALGFTGDTEPSPTTADVLEAVDAIKTSMRNRFNSLESSLVAVKTSLREFGDRVDSLETAVQSQDKKTLQVQNEALKSKLDDLEGRSRRQKIKIIGVPEGSENSHTTKFVASLLAGLFGSNSFADPVTVARGHQSLGP